MKVYTDRYLVILAAFFMLSIAACGSYQPQEDGTADADRRLPTGKKTLAFSIFPYLQLPASNTMTVMFETTDAEAEVWFRPSGEKSDFYKVNTLALGDDGYLKQATLKNLQASTLYDYYVLSYATGTANDQKAVSKKYQFKTYPETGTESDTFSLLAISDTQNNSTLGALNDVITKGVVNNICEGQAQICANKLIGITISGDVVNKGADVQQWRMEFFDQMKAITPYVPLIPVPGNHDYGDDAELSNYRHFFQLPQNGSLGFEEQWYYLDYANLRMIGLDSYPVSKSHGRFRADTLGIQRQWLREQLHHIGSDHPIDYAIGMFHHPCLSEMWLSGESIGSCEMVAEFEDFSRSSGKISAHIFGHTHAYSRGQSMDARHLWLNAATASGYREKMNDDKYYQTDIRNYGIFEVSHSSFGFNILTFNPHSAKALELKRYRATVKNKSEGRAQLENKFTVFDHLTIQPGSSFDAPLLINNIGGSAADTTTVGFTHPKQDSIYEVQWQISRDENFQYEVFDIWGNETRTKNLWPEQNGTIEGLLVNKQEGVDLTSLDLAALDGHIYVGGDERHKWQKREKEHSHASFRDPFTGEPAPALKLHPGETWYWRVRVRDSHLNWSDWSAVGEWVNRK